MKWINFFPLLALRQAVDQLTVSRASAPLNREEEEEEAGKKREGKKEETAS